MSHTNSNLNESDLK